MKNCHAFSIFFRMQNVMTLEALVLNTEHATLQMNVLI